VIDEENTVVETNNYRSSTKTRRNPLLEGRRAIPLACLERRSYGEPALLKSGVEPGEGGQMPGKKYLTNANTTKEGFTGKERDKHSGLDYFGARYYDAGIGKWLSVDPLSEKYHNYSSYNYVLGNPLIYFDPDGKQVRGESYVFKKHWKNLKDLMHPELAQYYIKFYSVTLGAASLATLPVSSGMSLIYSSAGLTITYATGENDDRVFNTVTFALGAATTDVRLAITIGTVQLIVDICSDPNFKSQKQDDFMSADNTGVDLPSEVRSPVEYRIYKKDGKWVVELVKKDEIDEEQSEYEDYFDKNWKDTNVKYYEPVTGASTIFIKEALQTNENE
jgi:RHS repeat-associated protein